MISEKNYDIGSGTNKVFLSDNPIKSKAYCRVFIDILGEGTWSIVDDSLYDVINDAVVFITAPQGEYLSLQVATTPSELSQNPSENTLILSMKNEIKNVSNNLDVINSVNNNLSNFDILFQDVLPYINEILQADNNATIASNKATEASNRASEANVHAGNALTASNISYKWANNPEDVPVSGGEFSAYHWATKASKIVGDGIIDDNNQTYITTYSSLKIEDKLSGKLGNTDTAQSATKLATPRNIVLQGDLDGITTFDGSSSVSIDATLDIDGATDIGADLVDADLIMVDKGANGTNRKSTISRIWNYISGKLNGAISTVKTSDLTADKVVISNSSGKIGISTVASSLLGLLDSATDSNTANTLVKRDSNGNFSAGLITGTITKADKWTTPRIIILDGDITGSVSVDGSQNVTINTKLNMDILDYVNARDYFIIGEADDTGSIQRALATGKNVKLDGIFTISSGGFSIGLGGTSQLIFGMNPRADRIRVNFNDGTNIFNLMSDYASLTGIGFEMVSGMKTSGSYVAIVNPTRKNIISNFKMQHCAKGISIDAEAVITVITDGEIADATSGTGLGVFINGGNDTFISKVVMDSSGAEPLAGIRIKRTQAVFISDVDIIDFGNPLLIDPDNSVSDLVTWCFFNSLACDTSSGHGIKIAPTGGVTVKGLFFDNCWSASNDLCGAYIIATGGAAVDGVFFTDSGLIQNTNEGLFVEGNVANVEFNSGRVTGNGRGNNSKAGIRFASTVNGFAVRGSRIGAIMGMPVSQTYGIVAEGNPNNFIIDSNNLTGNITDGDLVSNISLASNSSHLGNIGTTVGNYKNGKKIWDESNDGTGSGLDADLLDGMQPTTSSSANSIGQRGWDAGFASSYFYANGANARFEASSPVNDWKFFRLTSSGTPKWDIATNETNENGALAFRTGDGANRFLMYHTGELATTNTMYLQQGISLRERGTLKEILYHSGEVLNIGQGFSDVRINNQKAWHAGNVGFDAGATPNTAVYRNGYGNFAGNDIVAKNAIILDNATGDTPAVIMTSYGHAFWEMDVSEGRFRVRTTNSGSDGEKLVITPYSATPNESYKFVVPSVYNNLASGGAIAVMVDGDGGIRRASSSIKYKTNVEDIYKEAVDTFFANARPIYYKDKHPQEGKDWGYWGFIAEEVAEFDKRLVHYGYSGTKKEIIKKATYYTENDVLPEGKEIGDEKTPDIISEVIDTSSPLTPEGIMYDRITVLLTAKVQEQQKEIDYLKSQLEDIKCLLNIK